jgi:hypothetical protein
VNIPNKFLTRAEWWFFAGFVAALLLVLLLLPGCVNSTVHVTIGLWRSAASETGQVSNSVGTGGTVEVPLVKERSQ